MRIWCDADACPRPVKEVLYRAAVRTSTRLTLVANQPLTTPKSNWIDTVQVPSGLDVADHHILEHLSADDLVVTADIPLAAEVIEKAATAVNPRGELYTEANVRERLSVRDFMTDLRSAGVQTGGPRGYSDKDKQAFANALDRWLTQRSKS
jgi:uncharacterized protein YaiI (UPF0178 family)